MIRVRDAAITTILLCVCAAIVARTWHADVFEGINEGPDFISAIQSGEIAAEAITSVEVVKPAIGHTPFSNEEYASLPRLAEIDSFGSIRQLVHLWKACKPGHVHQNHPASIYEAYIKVNIHDDFYWLYCDVNQDDQGQILHLRANTRHTTNPNGASMYHLDRVTEVLAILQNRKPQTASMVEE